MNRKNVHIKSFGCQMNKLDTALVTSALQKEGFSFTDEAAIGSSFDELIFTGYITVEYEVKQSTE
ncbi:MAG: hypothetical protein ACYTFE_07545 [Planctomycetota bacterium]|jgi:tRNA A37 methylthiotransferase MiaB